VIWPIGFIFAYVIATVTPTLSATYVWFRSHLLLLMYTPLKHAHFKVVTSSIWSHMKYK